MTLTDPERALLARLAASDERIYMNVHKGHSCWIKGTREGLNSETVDSLRAKGLLSSYDPRDNRLRFAISDLGREALI